MTAIEFNNISKQYRLGLVSTKTLSHDLNRWYQMNILGKEDPYLKIGSINDRTSAADSDYVWALKNIDFKIEQGDVVGIIGKNGAGKSTLLKILSRVTTPTTGTIKARGRIASLLEVGTGFHPEMTGRENIFMNGAIMGMTKKEIKSKLDEIVAFSGCERYVDTPTKRYSSGMTVRLGFAIAAFLEPEILVVDEVLAVGDAEFQKKAIGKMQDVSKGEGRTVLFVSHNMESVSKLCNNGLLLKNGTIDSFGSIGEIITKYQSIDNEHKSSFWIKKDNNIESEYFNLNSFRIKEGMNMNENIVVEIEYTTQNPIKDITIGISLFDIKGNYIYRSLHTDINDSINNNQKTGINKVRGLLPVSFLRPGEYVITMDVSRHNSGWIIDPHNETKKVLSFTKLPDGIFSPMQSTKAIISPAVKWELNNKS